LSESDIKGAVITAQTGWDEAFLIGTEAELLALAQNIINSVNVAKADEFFGEQVRTSNLIYGELASHSELAFDWLVVTKDSEQTLEISHRVKGL
jgi:hypothetical protein